MEPTVGHFRQLLSACARAQRYLHAVTGPKLEGIVHEAMLSVGAESHMEAQLRDPALGLRAQLIGDEHEALALQYELLRASTARGGAAGRRGGWVGWQ